ncbi:MAG: hypothetical protein FRX49_09443 [Trebouxia sp. A1-2]|nr:MAG: hypothetical protein FRX49_09443 [Trebouxia sp. A1-2]
MLRDDKSLDATAGQFKHEFAASSIQIAEVKSALNRKGNNSADEKGQAQQKTTEGSDATAPKTKGHVTEDSNNMDAAEAKVSSVAESQELQESIHKDAAKEASKVHFLTVHSDEKEKGGGGGGGQRNNLRVSARAQSPKMGVARSNVQRRYKQRRLASQGAEVEAVGPCKGPG